MATVSITVPRKRRAGFTKGADQVVSEDAKAQSVTGWASGISAGPSTSPLRSELQDDQLQQHSLFTAAGQPKISPDGTLTYTPAKDANGSATVSVKATTTAARPTAG